MSIHVDGNVHVTCKFTLLFSHFMRIILIDIVRRAAVPRLRFLVQFLLLFLMFEEVESNRSPLGIQFYPLSVSRIPSKPADNKAERKGDPDPVLLDEFAAFFNPHVIRGGRATLQERACREFRFHFQHFTLFTSAKNVRVVLWIMQRSTISRCAFFRWKAGCITRKGEGTLPRRMRKDGRERRL